MVSSPCSSDIHLLPKNKLALLRMPFAVILLGKDVVYTLVIIFLAKLQPWIFILTTAVFSWDKGVQLLIDLASVYYLLFINAYHD